VEVKILQENRMARKVKIKAEGTELKELIKFGEINQEDISVEVPMFDRIVTILAGVEKLAPIPMSFLVRRDDPTLIFLKTWREDREIKDVTVIEYDGTGTEYSRLLMSQCELGNAKIPEYTAESPTYAQVEFTLYPVEILPIG
jgi:hypothetical protein